MEVAMSDMRWDGGATYEVTFGDAPGVLEARVREPAAIRTFMG